MRHLWSLWVFIFLQFPLAEAQPYRSFKADTVSFHRGVELFTALVDSVKIVGQDTTFFINHYVQDENGLPGNCTQTTQAVSWLGPKIYIPNNGGNYYYNKFGDSILIQTTPGVGWVYQIYHYPNGDYLEAAFVGHQYTSLGDSGNWVKTIRLQLKNSAGIDQPHIFNGKELKFSENYGWVQLYNLWLFPTDTNTIYFYGLPKPKNGKGNCDSRAIFNITPGDEFHYKQYSETCGFPGCWIINTLEKRFAISRTESVLGDTITLSYLRVKVDLINDPITGLDTLKIIDTVSEQIVLSEFKHLDLFNRKTFDWGGVPGYSIIYFPDSTGPRPRKELFLDIMVDTINNCIETLSPADPSPKYVYGDGLGLTYFYDDTSGISVFWRNLVYYQKGLEKWGQPIDFDIWLGIELLHTENKVSVYPNPVHDLANFDFKGNLTRNATVVLYNMMGHEVLRESFLAGHPASLQTSNLPAGIYVYRIDLNGKLMAGKFVKVQL